LEAPGGAIPTIGEAAAMVSGPDKKPKSFMEVVKTRRSVRKYVDTPIDRKLIDALCETARQGVRAFGFSSPLFLFVIDPGERKKVSRAVFSGWFGKINPWVLTTKAPCFIVACGNTGQAAVVGDKRLYLAETAIAMELVVLAAAELGLATCWLGGFGEEGVKKALGLGDELRIVAVSPLGYAPEKIRMASWDYMARNLVSKRRKPMEKIAEFVS
jgi:nitroreductase